MTSKPTPTVFPRQWNKIDRASHVMMNLYQSNGDGLKKIQYANEDFKIEGEER